jgi:hypothetical protein
MARTDASRGATGKNHLIHSQPAGRRARQTQSGRHWRHPSGADLQPSCGRAVSTASSIGRDPRYRRANGIHNAGNLHTAIHVAWDVRTFHFYQHLRCLIIHSECDFTCPRQPATVARQFIIARIFTGQA